MFNSLRKTLQNARGLFGGYTVRAKGRKSFCRACNELCNDSGDHGLLVVALFLAALLISGCASPKVGSDYPWTDPLLDPDGNPVKPPVYMEEVQK